MSVGTTEVAFGINAGWSNAEWSAGPWNQPGTSAYITGVQATSSLGTTTVNAEIRAGWSRLAWSSATWNQAPDNFISITGEELTTSFDFGRGWSREEWSSGNWNEALGLVLLEKNEYDLSLIYFSESAKLLNDQTEKKSNNQRFQIISKAKIEHDIEQFEYLASKNYDIKKFTDLALLYKKVASEINWPSDTSLVTLNNKYQSLLKDSYNRLVHISEAPKLKEKVINNSLNIEQITNDYFNHEFGLTYIDNFLSSKAIESLRDFLLESTIWFNVKQNGYVGAFLREGFANPLIIQIADELRTKFPKIFKNYPINHIWAFKYDSRSKNKKSSLRGINVHADFASINVNFWITPKKANLNPKSGGLIVYDVEAPKEWDFNTFNNDEKRIREELKKSKGNTKVIPYNENRAVIFNSNLFHETDSYEFKEGYENRRINVTLLFGRRKDN